jgi:hypothetical protein
MKLSDIKYHSTVEPVLRLVQSMMKNGNYITPQSSSGTLSMMFWLNSSIRYELMQWTFEIGPSWPGNPNPLKSITCAMIAFIIALAAGVMQYFFPNIVPFLIIFLIAAGLCLYWTTMSLVAVVVRVKKASLLTDFVNIVGIIPMIRYHRNLEHRAISYDNLVVVMLLQQLMSVSKKVKDNPENPQLKDEEKKLYDSAFKIGVLGDDIAAVYKLVYRLIEERKLGQPVGSGQDSGGDGANSTETGPDELTMSVLG